MHNNARVKWNRRGTRTSASLKFCSLEKLYAIRENQCRSCNNTTEALFFEIDSDYLDRLIWEKEDKKNEEDTERRIAEMNELEESKLEELLS